MATAVRAAMDAQIDVALHTLIQTRPPNLYYNVRVMEALVWEPWTKSNDAQYTMLLMVRTVPHCLLYVAYDRAQTRKEERCVQASVVIALYTVNTAHFNMDSTLFLGIMASHGFNPDEFQPRDPQARLPPPFDTGPPLGEGLAPQQLVEANVPHADLGATQRPMVPQSPSEHPQPQSDKAKTGSSSSAARKRVHELERLGAVKLQDQGLPPHMATTYPFLMQNADDLFLKDVRELLEQYHSVVLKYEALKLGLFAT